MTKNINFHKIAINVKIEGPTSSIKKRVKVLVKKSKSGMFTYWIQQCFDFRKDKFITLHHFSIQYFYFYHLSQCPKDTL